jgi:hypothetical protein
MKRCQRVSEKDETERRKDDANRTINDTYDQQNFFSSTSKNTKTDVFFSKAKRKDSSVRGIFYCVHSSTVANNHNYHWL